MQKWISRALAAGLLAASGFAQNAADLESKPVLRVADDLKCSCGCNQSMACKMEGDCQICRRAKTKIFELQQSGQTDSQILSQFAQENGKDVLMQRPGLMGAGGVWIAAAVGLGMVLLVIRRYRRQPAATGPEIDAATLGRIDQELSRHDLDELD
jgi:cytochrome c-type biogenesis protein CcmH/NrfF